MGEFFTELLNQYVEGKSTRWKLGCFAIWAIGIGVPFFLIWFLSR